MNKRTVYNSTDLVLMPLMVIAGQLNEKLKVAIEKAIVEIVEIKKITPVERNKDPQKPLFMIVFDREA